MKKFLRFIAILIVFISLVLIFLYISDYRYILRGASITYLNGYTTAFIDDYPEFENRLIEAGENKKEWPNHEAYNTTKETPQLKAFNQKMKTAAFLVIKNDSIWFEKYYDQYTPDSLTNSFSMAKSIVSAMLGKAIMQGHIKSLEQPVSDFFPQFDPALKVGDLSSMASGLNWNENYYNPFGMTARAYFDEDINDLILNLEVTETPGEEFKYLSGNTQLLAMVITKATKKSLSGYLSDSFWKPLGMQHDALWQLDQANGMEKAYCCISSNARDFARFGKLYKNHGKWEGEQILDSAFVAKSIKPRFKGSPQYGYGLWLSDHRDKDIFYLRGVLGQYVIVIPEDNLIIVRLGRKFNRPEEEGQHSKDFFKYIDETYKMLNDAA